MARQYGAPAPRRGQVASVVRDLIAGVRSRAEVTVWAMHWIAASNPGVDDPVVWRALGNLVGADAPTTDRPSLFAESDFRAWLAEIERTDRLAW